MQEPESNGPPTQGATFIVMALAFGMTVFAVVLYFLHDPANATPGPNTFFRSIVAVVGVVAIPFALVVTSRLSPEAHQRKDEILTELKAGRLHQLVFSRHLLGAAAAEGAGLLGAAAFHVTGDKLLLVAPMVALPVLLMTAPTESKTRHLIERV